MYVGYATFPDGTTISTHGTFAQLADWADDIIRTNGQCTITIEQEEHT